jgi:hypothetical protein
VRRRGVAGQEARGAEHERAGAHRRDVLRGRAEPRAVREGLGVVEERALARAAGDEQEVRREDVGERARRDDLHAGVGADRREMLPDELDGGVGDAGEDLVRTRQIELRQPGVQQHRHVDRHGPIMRRSRLAMVATLAV